MTKSQGSIIWKMSYDWDECCHLHVWSVVCTHRLLSTFRSSLNLEMKMLNVEAGCYTSACFWDLAGSRPATSLSWIYALSSTQPPWHWQVELCATGIGMSLSQPPDQAAMLTRTEHMNTAFHAMWASRQHGYMLLIYLCVRVSVEGHTWGKVLGCYWEKGTFWNF